MHMHHPSAMSIFDHTCFGWAEATNQTVWGDGDPLFIVMNCPHCSWKSVISSILWLGSLHMYTLHCISLRLIALRYIALHCIACITSHTLHYLTSDCPALHCIAWLCVTYIALHWVGFGLMIHYIMLRFIALHYTLHYTLRYILCIALRCIT